MYTKLTTMTWPSAEAQLLPFDQYAGWIARDNYIANAVASGSTDGVATIISPTVTSRVWLDQTTADDWATFIYTVATNEGVTVDVAITSNV